LDRSLTDRWVFRPGYLAIPVTLSIGPGAHDQLPAVNYAPYSVRRLPVLYKLHGGILPMSGFGYLSARKSQWLSRKNGDLDDRCTSVSCQPYAWHDWQVIGRNCRWLQAALAAGMSSSAAVG